MPISKETRQARHEHADAPRTKRGQPHPKSGNVGDQAFTQVSWKGLVHFVKGDHGWKEMSSSTGDFDANTIRIGGTSFNKIDLDNLKQGKSITTTTINQDISYEQYIKPEAIISDADNSTYTKYTIAARIGTFVSGTLFHDLNLNGSNNYAQIGNGNTDIILSGSISKATIDGGTF